MTDLYSDENIINLLNISIMKTQTILFMKTIKALLFLLAVISIIACGDRQGQSKTGDKQSQVSQSVPEAPELDIHTAILMGDIKTVNLHIKAGSDLNIKEPNVGSSPLITAVVIGRNEIAQTLIDAGADLDIVNNDGSTALYTAAFFGRTEIVKMLLEKGADKDVRNNFGSTALESVSVPFESLIGIYDQIGKDLGPLGLKLDYDQLKENRPLIAEMLQETK